MERITYSFIPNPYISIMTGCKYMRVPLVPLHLGCTSYINKQRKTTINNNKKKVRTHTKKKESGSFVQYRLYSVSKDVFCLTKRSSWPCAYLALQFLFLMSSTVYVSVFNITLICIHRLYKSRTFPQSIPFD